MSESAELWRFRTAADVAQLVFVSFGFRRTFPGVRCRWSGLVAVSIFIDADSHQHVRELIECPVCRMCESQSQLVHHTRHEPTET